MTSEQIPEDEGGGGRKNNLNMNSRTATLVVET